MFILSKKISEHWIFLLNMVFSAPSLKWDPSIYGYKYVLDTFASVKYIYLDLCFNFHLIKLVHIFFVKWADTGILYMSK